jgi:RHS repeat-associated protein
MLRCGIGAWRSVALLFTCAVFNAAALEQRFTVYVDTDSNSTTGCTIATVSGARTGVEAAFTAVADTSATPFRTTRLERQNCAAGILSTATVYDASGIATESVGTFTGVTLWIPQSVFVAPTAQAFVASVNSAGDRDVTASFPITARDVPVAAPTIPVPLSPWLLALIAASVTGLALRSGKSRHWLSITCAIVLVGSTATAIAVVVNGANISWLGRSAVLIDAADANPNADVNAIYTQFDANAVYVRIDADLRKDVATATNSAPTISGLAATATLASPTTPLALAATVTDDGLPNPPAVLTLAWTKVSGPGTVTFTPANAASTSAAFSAAGLYVIRLSASDSALTTTRDVAVTVNTGSTTNAAPAISNLAATASVSLSINALVLNPTITDDGLPNPPATTSASWSKISGPGTVTFSNAALAGTTASFSASGTYVLRLTASDSVLSTTSDVTVTVLSAGTINQAPIVTAGANQSIVLPATASLAGSATDDGLPNPPGALIYSWSTDSGPSGAVAIFSNPGAPASTATFTAPGVYVLRLTASDGALGGSSTLQVTVAGGAPTMAAIPDRSIPLGTRFQQLIVASDGNAKDTLTYSLPTAPAGATLSPAPLIDWTPTVGQVGTHSFTANVRDAAGNSISTSFRVTVTHVNRAPTLAAQIDVIVPIGTAFSRTLAASDPDAGDTLTFALVSGPAGMNLSGNALTWPTTGAAGGDYNATIKVTDAASLSDIKSFTVTLLPANVAALIARDDAYTVQIGNTLTVPAAQGVLANDVNPRVGAMTALKQADPSKGSVSAFNADGSFTYVAPGAPAPNTFNPVLVKQQQILESSTNHNWQLVDLNGDGHADIVFNHLCFAVRGCITAFDIKNNAQLWTTDASADGCTITWSSTPFNMAVGDVDDDGVPDIVMPGHCSVQNTSITRILAFNGRTGAFKWRSSSVHEPATDPFGIPALPSDVMSLTIARLRTGEKPSILVGRVAANAAGARTPDGTYIPQCASIVATVPDGYSVFPSTTPHYLSCAGVIVLNGETGAITQRMIQDAGNGTSGSESLWRGQNGTGFIFPAMALDFDGSGQNKIMMNGAIWNLDGTKYGTSKPSHTLAIGVGNFDDTPDIEMVLIDQKPTGITLDVKKADGRALWSFRLPTSNTGHVTIADIDGDGKPDILFNMAFADYEEIWAVDHRGKVRWIHRLPCFPIGGCAGSTFLNRRVASFDLDGDGVAEVIFPYNNELRFLDGATGKVKGSIPTLNTSNSSYEANAKVIDADNDGHADVVLVSSGIYNCVINTACFANVMVFSDAAKQWRPTRKIDNQFAYFGANINEDGTIPTVVPLPNNFATLGGNVFGTQPQVLAPVDPRVRDQTNFTYTANNGALSSAPATVRITIDPANRPAKFVSTPPSRHNGSVSYQAVAVDPDVGDSLIYAIETIASSGSSCTINAATGLLTCTSLGYLVGQLDLIIISATDSFGAKTLQSIAMVNTDKNCTVPNIAGQTQAVASAAIIAAGCGVGEISETNAAIPSGQVISQLPIAATVILGGEAVSLVVSKGPAPGVVPYVVGESLTAANAKLALSTFVSTVTTQFSTTIPTGLVMAQVPVAGTVQAAGATNPVALTVSAGPPLALPIASIVIEPGPGPFARLTNETQPFKAIAIFTDGTSADITLSASWTTSSPTIATVNAIGLAKGISAGSATISAALGGKTANTALEIKTRTSEAILPSALITAPAIGSSVTGSVVVIGSATDANFLRYELAYALATDLSFTLISEGNTAVTNGTLGTLDTTVLVNDQYVLRLRVFDRAGNQTEATTDVVVTGNMKVGLFSLGYQDINIPLAGIPIAVGRTYDSRDKAKGDFGFGWRVGVQTLRLRSNRVLGTGWVRNLAGAVTSLSPTAEHKVTLTLGDGRVEVFDMVVSPTSNLGSLDATSVIGYAARPGTLGKLQSLDNNSLLILNGGLQDELVDDLTLNTYHPRLFRYTTLDGTMIDIDRVEGVKKLTDANGNSLTFSAGGIIHSSGRSITFTRDLQNRITQITDPMGNAQSYVYDANGDLIRHINALGNASQYKYDRNHGLIEIIDPLGNRAVRNDYDANGRLISITDANGKQITFTHNVGAQEEVITDRRGNADRLTYDANGNVTSKQKGVTINGALLNAVTTLTYDALNNETSRIDADGLKSTTTFDGILPLTSATDPTGLNLNSAYAYNARKDVTSVTDVGGRNYAFTYDTNGNMTGLNVPANGATTSVSDARGMPISTRNSQGTVTNFTRDGFGRVTREEVLSATNTLLRRTEFTYDDNGKVLTQTLYRTIDGVLTTLTTKFTYDAGGRLTTTTNPLGGVNRTEYDAAGRVAAQVDALGRRTAVTYDALGRATRTIYPDGSFDETTYDVDGNIVATTDQVGRTTRYVFDELNRNVSTTFPDGGVVQTIYSPGGKITATIDANGNRTDYAYDSAGRPTTVTQPSVVNGTTGASARPRSSRTLNASGTPIAVTDAMGRTTNFTYDAAGRPTVTTFADGATTQQTFNSLGLKASITNEDGETNSYTYDGLGRLIAVSGLAGDATYVYDEAGNLLRKTDALGRVTLHRFDALNRLIERQLPGGTAERFTYDAVGNLVARVDSKGQTTTLSVDAMNRLAMKSLASGTTVRYTYAADGQRATVVDARGTTTYGYNAGGRIASVTHPTGEALSYTYDGNGNLLSLVAPASTVTYSYDALNRLNAVTAPEGTTQYFYDLSGSGVRKIAANGVVTDFNYNVRRRPTLIEHKSPSNVVLQSFANTYSPGGRRTRVAEADGSVENYSYDTKGRLSRQLRTGTNPLDISHVYDAVGNRTQINRNGVPTNFTFNASDQLISDGAGTYAYDANGNLASIAGGPRAASFAYDAEDQLIAISGTASPAQFDYDADGNRVRMSGPGGASRFLIDGQNNTGLSQIIEERGDAGSLQARYSYGGDLIAQSRGGAASFPLADVQGSIRALTNPAGAVTDRYQYDAYGSSVSAVESTVNPYRYGGQRLDMDSGLYQLRARYYDPTNARFMTHDPLSGQVDSPVSQHRYLYARADPTNFSDPTGLEDLASLSVSQGISATVDAGEFVSKIRAGCKAISTLDQIESVIFVAEIGVQLAMTGIQLGASFLPIEGVGGFKKIGWAGKGELVLVDIENKKAKSGNLSKFAFSLTSGSGKAGAKSQWEVKDQGGGRAVEITWPPLGIKGGAKFAEKVTLAEYSDCGLVVGKVELEPYVELYGTLAQGNAGKSRTKGVGGKGGMDLKLGLFGGRFKSTIPLIGLEFDGSKSSATFTLGGFAGGL